MSVFAGFASLVGHLADLLEPLFHTSATAAAIILFTAVVRLLVHPLARAAARGQQAKARLSPRIAELRAAHRKNPEKLQKELAALYAEERVSPLAGCLPSLLQIPAFFLLYQLFSRTDINGGANALLGHTLFGTPLGDRWADALGRGGFFGAQGLVYVGLFVIVAAVATFSYRRNRRAMAMNAPVAPVGPGAPVTAAGAAGAHGAREADRAPGDAAVPGMDTLTKIMPLMSFLTLFTVAVVPLAAALYVVTSTTWTAVERAVLYRVAA